MNLTTSDTSTGPTRVRALVDAWLSDVIRRCSDPGDAAATVAAAMLDFSARRDRLSAAIDGDIGITDAAVAREAIALLSRCHELLQAATTDGPARRAYAVMRDLLLHPVDDSDPDAREFERLGCEISAGDETQAPAHQNALDRILAQRTDLLFPRQRATTRPASPVAGRSLPSRRRRRSRRARRVRRPTRAGPACDPPGPPPPPVPPTIDLHIEPAHEPLPEHARGSDGPSIRKNERGTTAATIPRGATLPHGMVAYVTVADVMTALGRSKSYAYAHLARARAGRACVTIAEWNEYATRTFGTAEAQLAKSDAPERARREDRVSAPPTALARPPPRERPNPFQTSTSRALVPTVKPRRKPRR